MHETWQYECVGLMQLKPEGLNKFESKIQISNSNMASLSAFPDSALNINLTCLIMHENGTDG